MSHVVGGCSTYSKVAFRGVGCYPERIVYCYSDGVTVVGPERDYIDWTASLGAMVLGQYDKDVFVDVERQLLNGHNPPYPAPVEEEAAALLCEATGWEVLRWCKNGSDALEAAVRIARHVTGAPMIITNSYHGSHDCLVGATPGKAGGVMEANLGAVRPATSPQTLLYEIDNNAGMTAAVVMEPLTPGCQDWQLDAVRERCTQWGIPLIFDEMITGFRCRYGSAAPDVRPDLACYGKAIASGFPLACVTGRRDWMELLEHSVFMSGTYAAEALSLAACKATLTKLQALDASLETSPYAHINRVGAQLREALGDWVQGYTARLTFKMGDKKLRPILGALARKGILVGRDWFPMVAHREEHVERTIKAIREVKEELGD